MTYDMHLSLNVEIQRLQEEYEKLNVPQRATKLSFFLIRFGLTIYIAVNMEPKNQNVIDQLT